MRASAGNPAFLPAHVLATEIGSRRLSPVDLVGALLERIRTGDPKLHAFVEVYTEDARLAAEAAEKAIRSGHAIGPLHGIPIALKDLIEIKGKVTTGGSEVWRDRRSRCTATLARRLIAAGLIVIGKTHTVEFAMGGWGTNQHRGTPWNPWDPTTARTPGGSSSGSGVAVAAGFAPWAVGTVTGVLVRAQRPQDDNRAGQHLRDFAAQPDPRYTRTDGALSRGRGTALPGHARARCARLAHSRNHTDRSSADAAAGCPRLATGPHARGRMRGRRRGGTRRLQRSTRELGAARRRDRHRQPAMPVCGLYHSDCSDHRRGGVFSARRSNRRYGPADRRGGAPTHRRGSRHFCARLPRRIA